MLLARLFAAALLACGFITTGFSTVAADDAAWLRDKGTLIFKDTFDREEDGNLAAAIGNGWNSATANRVPQIKQADLDGGVLKVTSAVEAGHQAHIHHEAGFEDGGAIVSPGCMQASAAGDPGRLVAIVGTPVNTSLERYEMPSTPGTSVSPA